MKGKYYNQFGLIGPSSKNRKAQKEINRAIRQFRKEMGLINKKYPEVAISDTVSSEAISQKVYGLVHRLP